jgi:S-adenosylmethionine hydrolase
MPRWSSRSAEEPSPVITLLSDYGSSGVYVGVLHAVIARICPDARIIDVTHRIEAGDLLGGALALADALQFVPVGVHLAVVDPGVGSDRHALALRCRDGRILVGPDNGLLGLAAELAGGVVEVVEISDSPRILDPVSATFHGRDIFAPVAAALAAGKPLVAAGDPLDATQLIELELPMPQLDGSTLIATVTTVDGFGNLALMALASDAAAAGREPGSIVSVHGAERTLYARYGRTFSDVGAGRLLLFEDSNGRLALAINGGSAAETLGTWPGDKVRLGR